MDLKCSSDGTTTISAVDEPKTCEYVMSLSCPQACAVDEVDSPPTVADVSTNLTLLAVQIATSGTAQGALAALFNAATAAAAGTTGTAGGLANAAGTATAPLQPSPYTIPHHLYATQSYPVPSRSDTSRRIVHLCVFDECGLQSAIALSCECVCL